MSKKPSLTLNNPSVPGFTFVQSAGNIHEYRLNKNGLRVLFHKRPDTGVITTNITYFVGARDEARGETGLAHMLEHMLFKPTTYDIARNIDSASMQFERETGCILNANTWKDRTTYFFSYPTKHFERALTIEAERMNGVVLTDESLKPERDNVLSEFDMNNGDPYFALAVAMVSAGFQSHSYGHETIGYREDIEDYTAAKLESFYRQYYRPDNAVLMVIGDIELSTALSKIKKVFSSIEKPPAPITRIKSREPKQEGIRLVTVTRPSQKQIISFGFKHAGFPSNDWFRTAILLDVLTGNAESVLHKALVDTGIATSVDGALEPTSEVNLGMLTITAAPKQSLETIEKKVRALLASLTVAKITPLVKNVKAQFLTSDAFKRDRGLDITQELTEYVSAGDWTRYTATPEILDEITPKQIHALLQTLFTDTNLTIGYFIGTN